MLLALTACAAAEPELTAERLTPEYSGIAPQLLDDDLVQFRVSMTNALSVEDVQDYADCAAAGYTLIRGWSFARHVRTTVEMDGAQWTGDAVYTISPDLPRGLRTIDAEVVAAACDDKKIPTV